MTTRRKPRAFYAAKGRGGFSILATRGGAPPRGFLHNGAPSPKTKAVVKALEGYYYATNANIHRGVHYLSAEATDAYDRARVTVAKFLNAAEPRECLFVRGTTEAINLVAFSWGRQNLKRGDEILLTG